MKHTLSIIAPDRQDFVFSEMVRVLRPGGKLVMIDMEAAVEELRDRE